MIEDISFLINDYYHNVNEFSVKFNYNMPELLSGLDNWLRDVNSYYTQEGYLYITPKENYLEKYNEVKNYIKLWVLEINYNYDKLCYISNKIGDNYFKIKLINSNFEDEEYNICLKKLNKLTNKVSSPINITVIAV